MCSGMKNYQKIARFQSLLRRYIICEQTPPFWKINMEIMKVGRAWYFLTHVSYVKGRPGAQNSK